MATNSSEKANCVLTFHYRVDVYYAQFTKMAANGSEKAFCMLTFHYRVDVCRITKGAHIEHL